MTSQNVKPLKEEIKIRGWLYEARKNKDVTMLKIASQIGISESGYCMIESGERRPSVETAKKIAAALGFNWTRFFEDEPQEPEPT